MAKNKELMKIRYRDGRMLTIREVVDLHPDLTTNVIRMRILKKGADNIEELLAPVQVPETYLDKIPIDGMGPRKNVEDLQEPTDYERQLWGY